MSARVVSVPMQVGDIILQVEAVRASGSENTSTLSRSQEIVSDAFTRARGAILAIAQETVSTMAHLGAQASAPDDVEIKFGLKFAADGGVIFAGVSSEASLEVTLKYKASETDLHST